MADHLSRQDLKRNELGEALEAGIHYAEDHLRTILLAAGGLLVVALAGWGVFAWQSSRKANANELLARALSVAGAEVVESGARPDDPLRPSFASESARRARALELFTELEDRYGSTSVGRVANVYLGEAAYEAGDRERARRYWEAYLEGDARSAVAATVRVNLFRLDREEGKAEALAATLQKLLEDPARSLPGDVLLYQLALTHDQLGRTAEARAAYRRIVDEHPQSPYYQTAQQQSSSLGQGS